MSWIQYCKCQRQILSSQQIREELPCDICQEEYLTSNGKLHEARFHQMFDVQKSDKLQISGY